MQKGTSIEPRSEAGAACGLAMRHVPDPQALLDVTDSAAACCSPPAVRVKKAVCAPLRCSLQCSRQGHSLDRGALLQLPPTLCWSAPA